MTGNEVKKKIDNLYIEMEHNLLPDHFTLNKKMVELNQEVFSLQQQCPHEFKNGECIYCHKMED